RANFYGSLTQASTTCLGTGPDGRDIYIPFKDILPMVDPVDIAVDGWDICSDDLAVAMEKAAVLNWNLQQKLKPHLKKLQPRASIYRKDFIAANQEGRANNLISGTNWEAVTRIREDIRDFKAKKQLDKPVSIVSYNHLGNNDGMNLSAPKQFRSKEISKSNVVVHGSRVQQNTLSCGKNQTTV
ncbi:putative inositol-3-phosphate synthase 1-B-like, partial [Apostichopus japonicus]